MPANKYDKWFAEVPVVLQLNADTSWLLQFRLDLLG